MPPQRCYIGAGTFAAALLLATLSAHAAPTIIYTFHGPDGATPTGGLIADASGALYGTTKAGGTGAGTVFKLTPPAPGQTKWTQTVLHDFAGNGDSGPVGELTFDGNGALYGVTQSTVFQLSPPAPGQSQ